MATKAWPKWKRRQVWLHFTAQGYQFEQDHDGSWKFRRSPADMWSPPFPSCEATLEAVVVQNR